MTLICSPSGSISSLQPITCPFFDTFILIRSPCLRPRPMRWASPTLLWAPWCALPTMQMSRRTRQGFRQTRYRPPGLRKAVQAGVDSWHFPEDQRHSGKPTESMAQDRVAVSTQWVMPGCSATRTAFHIREGRLVASHGANHRIATDKTNNRKNGNAALETNARLFPVML